jgi:N-methylhydantoinase A
VLCALGSAAADVRQDFVRTVMQELRSLDFAAFAGLVDELAAEGVQLIEAEGVPVERVEVILAADMGYEGQRHDIRVALPAALSRESVQHAFDGAYRAQYRQTLPDIGIRLTALRVTVFGVRPRLHIGGWLAQRASGIQAAPARRRVYADGAWHDAEVHRRENLGEGSEIAGPAIVEQRDTTTGVDPGTVARVDAHGNLIMEASRS